MLGTSTRTRGSGVSVNSYRWAIAEIIHSQVFKNLYQDLFPNRVCTRYDMIMNMIISYLVHIYHTWYILCWEIHPDTAFKKFGCVHVSGNYNLLSTCIQKTSCYSLGCYAMGVSYRMFYSEMMFIIHFYG